MGKLEKYTAGMIRIISHVATDGAEMTPEIVAYAKHILNGVNEKTCDETKSSYDDNPLLALYDEVIQQCMIRDVVSSRIGLSQTGNTSMYRGICPFHEDHKPSLVVNTESQKFKCLSCGASGDVVDFTMRFGKLSEKEALIYIATIAGIDHKDFLKEQPCNQ